MNNAGKLLAAFAVGAAAGAVLGVLFAPDKGEKTREKIKDKGKKFAGDAKEKVKTAREKMEEVKDNIRHSVDEIRKKAEEFV